MEDKIIPKRMGRPPKAGGRGVTQISFELPTALLQQVDEAARQHERSRAWIIRRALEDFFANK